MIIPTIYQILAHLSKLNKRVLAKKVFIGAVIAIVGLQFIFPQAQQIAMAQTIQESLTNAFQTIANAANGTPDEAYPNTYPKSEARPRKTMVIPVTAYNSMAGQTDSTPCIAARGYNLCEANEENVIAANFLPMGAKVRFPDLYGEKEFTVVDRMNARYYYHADIWLKSHEAATSFGLKRTKIEIY